MTQNELRNQELNRHEEVVDRNIEHHQTIGLQERKRGIEAANQNSTVARVVNIFYFFFVIVEALLFVRLILQLLGADPASTFAGFIYMLSYPFVTLFANLVQNPTLGTTGVLEITTIIAMIVWAIVAWLVGRLMWLVLSRPR
jgi:hypothetical protein